MTVEVIYITPILSNLSSRQNGHSPSLSFAAKRGNCSIAKLLQVSAFIRAIRVVYSRNRHFLFTYALPTMIISIG